MAFITENTATGDGTTTDFSFTFPYLDKTDIRVTVEASAAGSDPFEQTKDTDWTLANATTISFTSAPANLSTVRIFRDTNLDDAVVTYFAGSAIRAEDLNENQLQVLYSAQEVEDKKDKKIFCKHYAVMEIIPFYQNLFKQTNENINVSEFVNFYINLKFTSFD